MRPQFVLFILLINIHLQNKLRSGLQIIIGGGTLAAGYMFVTGNEKFYRQCVMPTVRLLDAEAAHVYAVKLAKYGIVPLVNDEDKPSLVSFRV